MQTLSDFIFWIVLERVWNDLGIHMGRFLYGFSIIYRVSESTDHKLIQHSVNISLSISM